jgi:hypothetical protein
VHKDCASDHQIIQHDGQLWCERVQRGGIRHPLISFGNSVGDVLASSAKGQARNVKKAIELLLISEAKRL